jgi:hypothetical protein
MGFFKFVIWTGFSIGLGLFLASYDVGGQTPLERVRRAVDSASVTSAFERVKGSIGTQAGYPQEHYSAEDRAEVNRLARRATAK